MRVLVLGAKGMLGQELVRAFGDTEVTAWDREECDVCVPECEQKIRALKPDIIFNAIAYNDVDGAEGDGREAALVLNRDVPLRLAHLARDMGIAFAHYGSDYVFDGSRGFYTEDDDPHPINAYGCSKREGEMAVLASGARAYVIRLAWLFGRPARSSGGKKSFVDTMLHLASTQHHLDVVNDEASSPTYATDLAAASRRIVETQAPGLYHCANAGVCTWFEYAREIFRQANIAVDVTPVAGVAFPRLAKRPRNSSLVSKKLPPQRPWQEALSDYLSIVKAGDF